MNSIFAKLSLALVSLNFMLTAARADYTVISENFTNRISPQWRYVDSAATGSPWNLLTDSTTPLSGGAATNAKPTTQILRQFDTRTLAAVNDYIRITMSVRTPVTQNGGSFNVGLFNTPDSLTGDSFNYTSYPLTSLNGYAYNQVYGASLPTFQRVLSNAPATIMTATSGAVLGNTTGHTVVLKLTKVATGIKMDCTIDGVATTKTDTTPATYAFNTVRIDGGGVPINIDNVTLTTTPTVPSTTFTYTLPHTYITSAGVYDSTGKMVRHLWSKLSMPAGSYTDSWNNTADDGTTVPAGTYTIKVLYHNMNYTWDGVVGNTSSSFVGSHVWRALIQVYDLAFDSTGSAFISTAYNEFGAGVRRCATTDMQTPSDAVVGDYTCVFGYVASDGTNYYLANINQGTYNFVAAYKVSDGTPYTFSTGTSMTSTGGITYPSVIDYTMSDPNEAPTGLSVQASGSYLAVSHGLKNCVRIFNKATGALVNSISVTSPGQCSFAASGDLWVISGTTAVRYINVGTTPSLATTVTGFVAPLAIAADPTTNNVIVADGGTSQQVKCYNSTGTSQWVLGQSGGYAISPDVANDKFMFFFRNILYTGAGTSVAFQPDGSFWVADPGDQRVLHFSAARAYLGKMAFIADQLMVTVDPNNPANVYDGFLQYQVDYAKPLQTGDPDPTFGGNGSWKLAKNWSGSIDPSRYASIETVNTLSNGHTYAQMYDSGNPNWMFTFFDLPATGPARATGINVTLDRYLYGNGDLRYGGLTGSGSANTQSLYKMALSGFDASNNPLWSSQVLLGTTPITIGAGSGLTQENAQDPFADSGWGMRLCLPITSSNTVVAYNAWHSNSEPDTHLGGVATGGTSFQWKSSPGKLMAVPDGLGTFNDYSGYGGHDGIGVFSYGRNIVSGYDGQNGSFSCQFYQFYDDGLFVGQFGTTIGNWGAPDWVDDRNISAPGNSGNIGSMYLTLNSSVPYLYMSDESAHGGIHRWHLDGSTAELSASGALNATIALGTATAWPSTNIMANPSFESEASSYSLSVGQNYTVTPSAWQVNNGTDGSGAGAFYTEWRNTDSRSFPCHGTIAKSGAYTVQPYQIFTGLASGTYSARVWVKSSGGQTSATFYCKKTPLSATTDYSTAIPSASTWTQLTLSGIAITGGTAEIGIHVDGNTGQYIYLDDFSFTKP